jgi:hypothetical protein
MSAFGPLLLVVIGSSRPVAVTPTPALLLHGGSDHLLEREKYEVRQPNRSRTASYRKRQHFSAPIRQALPVLMTKLAEDQSLASFAARLLILTGARSHMVHVCQVGRV